jgi:predicted acyltransferase
MKQENQRVLSIDVLRGFDMFFIAGGASLIAALCGTFGLGDGWLAGQMKHVEWTGLTHHDTIFPLFLFLAGVSWPFSLAAQEAKGRSPWQIRLKALKRGLVLFLFGLSFGGILKFKPDFRLMSVLGFIGICWAVAALAFMQIRRVSMRILAVALLLAGFWALLSFCAASDAPAGADSYSLEGNIVSYLDRIVYPNHLLRKNGYEPESLFSVPNGVALAFIGMCMGSLLRSEKFSKAGKAARLAGWAAALLLLGAVFHLALGDQVVKKLWTTSFVLYATAYSTAMLALFYWLVDVKGFRAWTVPFMEFGMNSITIYLFMMLGIQGMLTRFFFTGLADWLGAPWSKVVINGGGLLIGWIFVHFLYRRKIFLRV